MARKLKFTSPLKWKKVWQYANGRVRWDAETPFGSYYVERDFKGRVTWSYFFREEYDEDTGNYGNITGAKRLMQSNWDHRIAPILEAARPIGG